jgi:epoxide hydrolase 4
MNELQLTANDLRFRAIADGPEDGPLVLLLHGFPEGAESWAAQLPALAAAGYRAVAPDLRGYGGTDCPEGEDAYRMVHLVADVAGLIHALGRERCHLAGHDWGALVGWSLASAHPDRLLTWSALSVGHPAAFAGTIRDDPGQRQKSSYIDLFRAPDGKAERVLAEDDYRRLRRMYAYGPHPDAIPPEHVDVFVRSMARPGRLTAGLNYYRANLGEEAEPMAPYPVTTPSQLIWGELDPAVGPAPTNQTERCVAGEYRLHTLPGAGHWLQFEEPHEVTRLLLGWMSATH